MWVLCDGRLAAGGPEEQGVWRRASLYRCPCSDSSDGGLAGGEELGRV